MKKPFLLLIILFSTYPGFSQFKASMENVKSGEKEIFSAFPG
jgi:hypothetical protein